MMSRRQVLGGIFSASALAAAAPAHAQIGRLFSGGDKERESVAPGLIKPGSERIGGSLSGLLNGNRGYREEGDTRYKLVYFGTAHTIPGCAADLAAIREASRLLESKCGTEIKKLFTPVFIHPDYPSAPMPGNLRTYVDAPGSPYLALHGTADKIHALAKGYGAVYISGPQGYAVNHSRFSYLMAPDGRNLAILPADVPYNFIAVQIIHSLSAGGHDLGAFGPACQPEL